MIIYLYMFCFYSEIMTPSLINILKDNTLTGDNYVTWKRKIGLLLQAEKHKFILSAPKPPAPTYESQIHMVGKVATVKTRQEGQETTEEKATWAYQEGDQESNQDQREMLPLW